MIKIRDYYCRVALLLVVCALTMPALAAEQVPDDVKHTLQRLDMAGAPVEWIEEVGLFEVVTSRGALYISKSGQHFIFGEWYSVESGQPVSQTQSRKAKRANALIATSFPEKSMVRFQAKGKARETLYVFTDPNCSYCRKFHTEVATLNAAGVNVYYIPYPVIREESRQDSINIWCAKDKNTAMTRAKKGESNPTAQCDSPVDTGLQLGKTLGINGTPYMVAKNANIGFAGYVPPARLLQQLGVN